jgi:hypothetical protein
VAAPKKNLRVVSFDMTVGLPLYRGIISAT